MHTNTSPVGQALYTQRLETLVYQVLGITAMPVEKHEHLLARWEVNALAVMSGEGPLNDDEITARMAPQPLE